MDQALARTQDSTPAPAAGAAGLLTAEDPPPFTWHNAQGPRALLVNCDHASNVVPRRLRDLGLSADQRQGHIAWDPGAGAVARLLATALGAPAILAGYSRLVIDCNRAPDDPTAIPLISDAVVVPGNRDLDDETIVARRLACHDPYHAEIARWLDVATAAHAQVAMFSVHSFTPSLRDGDSRPWDTGVLWTDDPRIPVPLMAALRRIPGVSVGDNEPYSAHDKFGFTIETHAEPRGLPNGLVEIRQDHLADEQGVHLWAGRLAEALDPILRGLGV